ncbi:zinc finger protein 79 [Coregonus clupeaformis]|uniref:zinc finger protein 79 n=1 Tax=Coregonus clupeaformis TaxID=59861 RepID=UPI001BE01659|nr:zinc finger protein 79 [Coregonus clupeaformis]XP_041695172.1 zinc finger protein 79 [Coregonus clupeaformis]XP_045061424.1 zinc finger protein 79 [Coregonus clupeaformis]
MDPGDKYGRYERSDQPEERFDHSLHWSEVKEEAEESQISAVSLGVETSQVCTKDDPDEQDPSFDTVSDIHGVTEQERGHKGITYLKVKVLPSPVPVKEESEECSLIPVDEEEVASITVKKEEHEDWLKSEDEDVVKVSVPWEPLETSPSSSCSDTEDTEDSEMESDNVRDCENHESDISGGLKIEDCSRIDPGMTPDTDVKANAVDFNESKGRSTSFYPCPHCTLGFTIERFFHGHLKRAHPEEYITLLKSGEIIAKKKKCSQLPPAMCLQCGKSFSNKYVMEKHQTSHTGEKPYHCADCGKSYVFADSLKKHQKRCGKGFRRQTQLTSHETIPTGERPYKCSQCGKGYRKPANLKAHQKTHPGEKPYQCSQCDKCFGFSRDLKRHRWTHTSERPYKCFECGKGFVEQTQLTSHELIHTGERPYKCSQCAKGYRRPAHLKRHEMTHT